MRVITPRGTGTALRKLRFPDGRILVDVRLDCVPGGIVLKDGTIPDVVHMAFPERAVHPLEYRDPEQAVDMAFGPVLTKRSAFVDQVSSMYIDLSDGFGVSAEMGELTEPKRATFGACLDRISSGHRIRREGELISQECA